MIFAGNENNRIVGNFIGTDATGAGALGNNVDGIIIATPGNEIGGDTEAEGNIIAHNGRGVMVGGQAGAL